MDALTSIFTGAPSISTPNTGETGGQYEQLLNQFLGGQSQVYNSQAQFQPQYTGLDLASMEEALNGTGSTPGVVGEYTGNILPQVTGAVNAGNTATRTAGVNDLTALAPGAVQAVQGANPQQTALLNGLTTTAGQQLQLGTQLDPNQVSQIDQSVETNWANRGLGNSDPAQLNEALQYFGAGQNLLGQRESEAGSVAGEQANLFTDPAFQVLTGTSGAPGVAAGVTSTGTNVAGAAINNPTISPQANYDLFNTTYNAQGAVNAENLNAQTGLAGGEIAALGGLGGAGIGAEG